MVKTTRIHLVRHGEVHNPDQILYGRRPRFALSRRGHRQARATGNYLKEKPLEAIFSSPLLRARQTAKAIVNHHNGLSVSISKHLNEVCTVYEGCPGAEVDARNGDLYTGSTAGYEQPPDLVRRVLVFFRRVLSRHCGSDVVAVTHGDIIVFAVLWALGEDLVPENKSRLKQFGYAVAYPEHASMTRFTFSNGSTDRLPDIVYVNPAVE